MRKATSAVWAAAGAAFILGCSGDPTSSEPDPNALEFVTPEQVGFSSAALQEIVGQFEQIGSHIEGIS